MLSFHKRNAKYSDRKLWVKKSIIPIRISVAIKAIIIIYLVVHLLKREAVFG